MGTSTSYADVSPIGEVLKLEGSAIKHSGNEKIPLNQGDSIYRLDNIETEPDGKLTVKFIDNTEITIGYDSVLVIDEYVYDPSNFSNNKATYSFPGSAFHYVSGLIAKKEHPEVSLKLDFGSIGIRGTEVWRDMIVDDNGSTACRIYVEDGSVDVSNDAGHVALHHGDGTKIYGLDKSPQDASKWKAENIADIKGKTSF